MEKLHMRPAAWIVPMAAAALMLGGCSDMFSAKATPRDYGELVDRMVKAIKGRSPEDAAANLFNVTSPDERRDAIAYLETKPWGHEPPYMEAYGILATDPHPMVRAQAMRALGTSYKESAGALLAKGLSDPDAQVRRDAACGLMSTWSPDAFAPLATCVKNDPDEQARIFAARALVHANTPDAYRALIDALGDRDAAVVWYAQRSLVGATGQNFSYDTQAWLTWYKQAYVSPGAGSVPASRPGAP